MIYITNYIHNKTIFTCLDQNNLTILDLCTHLNTKIILEWKPTFVHPWVMLALTFHLNTSLYAPLGAESWTWWGRDLCYPGQRWSHPGDLKQNLKEKKLKCHLGKTLFYFHFFSHKKSFLANTYFCCWYLYHHVINNVVWCVLENIQRSNQ